MVGRFALVLTIGDIRVSYYCTVVYFTCEVSNVDALRD